MKKYSLKKKNIKSLQKIAEILKYLFLNSQYVYLGKIESTNYPQINFNKSGNNHNRQIIKS